LDALGVTVVSSDDKLEVKILVPLEFTPIENVSEYVIISAKKYRKQEVKLLTAL
jgi:hypothetical protein